MKDDFDSVEKEAAEIEAADNAADVDEAERPLLSNPYPEIPPFDVATAQDTTIANASVTSGDDAPSDDANELLNLQSLILTPVCMAKCTSSATSVFPISWAEMVVVSNTPTLMPSGRTGSGTNCGAITLDGLGRGSSVTGFIMSRMSNNGGKYDYVWQDALPATQAPPRVVPTAKATPNHCYTGYLQLPPTVDINNSTASSSVTTMLLGGTGATCFIVNASEVNISSATYTAFTGWLFNTFTPQQSWNAAYLRTNTDGQPVYQINADPGSVCTP